MSKIENFLRRAAEFIGQPYRWGGGHGQIFRGTAPVDCSGLVSQAAAKAGLKGITGTAGQLQAKGQPVPMSQLKPGDLVFRGHPAHHVAIYIGKGKVLEAPHTGARVRISSVHGFTSARRVSNEPMTHTYDHTLANRTHMAGMVHTG